MKIISETLTSAQETFLLFSLLSPSLYLSYLLHRYNDGIIAFLCFHINLLLLPYLYIKFFSQKQALLKTLKEDIQKQLTMNRTMQLILGIGLMILIITAVLFVYSTILRFKCSLISEINLPVKFDIKYLVLIGVQYTVFNPVIEELFWRFFFLHTLDKRESNKFLVSFFYAAYHFFVLEYILGWQIGLICMPILFVAGLIFEFLRDYFGILTSILLHAGADFALILVLADLIIMAMTNQSIRTPAIFSERNIPIQFKMI